MAKSLKERLLEKKENLKKGGGGFQFFIIKEGTTRYRNVPVGAEEDWSLELTTLYLGKDLGLQICPSTFGMKSAFKEKYDELSSSKDPDDRELAKRIKPGRKFATLVYKYKDDKGKEVDMDNGVKPLIMTPGVLNDLLDVYLDEEFGDFTDKKNGYDIKYTRSGKGKNDTEYSIRNCQPTPANKELTKTAWKLEEEIKKLLPTYKQTKEMLEKFLSIPVEGEQEEKPVEKKKKKKKSKDL